jgi:hypothetical protein
MYVLFLGAGAVRACGLPDIGQLQERVLAKLGNDERLALEHQLHGRNLEAALSRLRRIAALVAGEQTVDGLTGDQAKALDAVVCQAIVQELNIETADLAPVCRLWSRG